MSFWGEGVEGDVALDIRYIGAIGCSTGSNTNTNTDKDNVSSDASSDAVVAAADAAIITSGNVQQRYQELSEGNQIFTLFCVISSMIALFSVVYILFVSNKKQKSYVQLKDGSIDIDDDQNIMIEENYDTEEIDNKATVVAVVV